MHEIAEMALAFEDIEHSLKLYKWITKYIQADYNRIAYKPVIQLLQRWSSQNANSRKFAIKLTEKIVFFRPDPDTEKKLNRQREVSSDEIFSGDTIEPKPICDDWEYQEILEKGSSL